jgi:hypothetical protein
MDMDGISIFLKEHRRNLAATLAGFSVASFWYHIYLWCRFMELQPRVASPTLGLIYPMNNHGSYYYLSATQATQLTMLFYTFVASSLLTAALNLPMQIKQPWEKYPAVPSLPWKTFWGSLVFSVGMLWLTSPHIASFLVFNGIIFDPW